MALTEIQKHIKDVATLQTQLKALSVASRETFKPISLDALQENPEVMEAVHLLAEIAKSLEYEEGKSIAVLAAIFIESIEGGLTVLQLMAMFTLLSFLEYAPMSLMGAVYSCMREYNFNEIRITRESGSKAAGTISLLCKISNIAGRKLCLIFSLCSKNALNVLGAGISRMNVALENGESHHPASRSSAPRPRDTGSLPPGGSRVPRLSWQPAVAGHGISDRHLERTKSLN